MQSFADQYDFMLCGGRWSKNYAWSTIIVHADLLYKFYLDLMIHISLFKVLRTNRVTDLKYVRHVTALLR